MLYIVWPRSEAAVCRCSSKVCNIHRKIPVLESLFNKVAILKNFIKKRLQHKCIPVNIARFLRTANYIEHLRWLLLQVLHVGLKKKVLKNQGSSATNTFRLFFFPLSSSHCFVLKQNVSLQNLTGPSL